jgi:excisionase family DNA binding protein
MPKLDEYVRIAKAAEYLGVHHNTLRNWGRTGKIPEYRHPVNNYRLF